MVAGVIKKGFSEGVGFFFWVLKDCPDLGRWRDGRCSSRRTRVRDTLEVGVGMAFDGAVAGVGGRHSTADWPQSEGR